MAAVFLQITILFSTTAWAEDEICASCGQQVSVTGSFSHHKDRPSVVIEGASDNAAAFHQDARRHKFHHDHLAFAGWQIPITINAATAATGPAERLFDVNSGDKVLAENFDIFASAGGARKVSSVTGTVEHEDDSLKGPLQITFKAGKGAAKFNTIDVKNAAGASVVSFSASELWCLFAAANHVPEISEAPIWRDSTKPLPTRRKRFDPACRWRKRWRN